MAQPTGWEGLRFYLHWVFADLIENPAQLSAMRAIPLGQHAVADRLREKTIGMLELLVQRAKAERMFRADRWIEDIYLLLSANEQIAHAGHSDPQASSARLLELALASLRTTRDPEPESPVETPSTLRLRAAIGHDLGGLPLRAVSDSVREQRPPSGAPGARDHSRISLRSTP